MVALTGLSLAVGKLGRTLGRERKMDILCPMETACLKKLGSSVVGYDGHYKNIYIHIWCVCIFWFKLSVDFALLNFCLEIFLI